MKSKKPSTALPAKHKAISKMDPGHFPIVGIGASAGGLEALQSFFQHMPDETGLSFVVIQHLDPNHKGIMPELLQRMTTMKVQQATDHLPVKPDCIYVIPPNKSLSILNGALYLFEPIEAHGLRLPIDFFLRSLAADRRENSVGIILSGMGSDGSVGLKSIKEMHGLVLVQDPASAKFDSMPRSAIESVQVDVVASAEALPAKLLDCLKLMSAHVPQAEQDKKLKSSMDKIIILLREQSGHDFSMYKKSTLHRRIERRKSVHQIESIHDYVRFMQENPKEGDILFKELLIGVTSFFRDVAMWTKLKMQILPDLIHRLPPKFLLRAWVCGCSTGEEAYSLAIVFKEVMEELKEQKDITLQIFATDLDADSIDKARRGCYPKNITADVSPERINRFFSKDGDGYRINSSIRETVVFAPQDVIKDPPFTKLDIITCRNMLIYMEPVLQQKLFSLFHYSLNASGILILGTAETLGNHHNNFVELDTKLKIYQRSAGLTAPEFSNFPSYFHHARTDNAEIATKAIAVENIQTLADQLLLQRFAPASVLVNEQGDILYITGRTGKYLEPVAGKANWNIHAMAREELRAELPTAFRKAAQNFDPVLLKQVKIGTNGSTQWVDVTIQRIENPLAIRGMIMVVFSDVPAVLNNDAPNVKAGKGEINTREKELEFELQRNKEDLQSTREEMQTSQEELRSTNEELQSTNEELQSSNEELTTSKEEMQSLNEELQTVNIELQSKVADFVHANDDMKNLLNSTEIACLFLDKELNIRRFTDPIAHIFKIRSSDIGRPFTDLVTSLQYPEMDKHARNVMKTLNSLETSITTRDNKWFSVRIMPYRTVNDHIDGLVITFGDITISKKLEKELKAANEALVKKSKKHPV